MKIQMLIKTISALCLALFFSLAINAQNVSTAPLSQDAIEASDDVSDSEYATDLKLTSEQKAAFKKANQEYKAKTKAAKNAKKEELQRLRAERIRAHKATLSPEQLKKYDEMLAKKAAKRQEKAAQKQAAKEAKKAEKKAGKKSKE